MRNGTAFIKPPDVKPRLDLSALEPGAPLRITNVGWDDYERFLKIVGDRRYRTDYADGEYEILMPSTLHAMWVSILCQIILALSDELGIRRRSLDAVTVRREDLEKGLEPDRCYYFENEARVRGKRSLDFNVDPPPDVAVEVEVASSIEKRVSIYAALRVPEIWRYKEDCLIVNHLTENGDYEVVERSRFFPQVPLDELVRFVKQCEHVEEWELMQSFRGWVRQQIAAAWPKPD